MKPKILIVDDEEGIRISLRGILEDEGYHVDDRASAEDAIVFFNENSTDLILLDVWMENMDGISLLKRIHETTPDLPVIMISGHGNIETAVKAIKHGAHDFIEKPLSLDKIIIAVDRALKFASLKKENIQLRNITSTPIIKPVGESQVMMGLKSMIEKVAPLDTWVLITGENGTGKELVAQSIHQKSKRAQKPMVAINCAAIPEELIESELFGHEKGAFTGAESSKVGKFEMAHEGTLFLDEIGDMSLKTQAKILRILQEKCFERVGSNRLIHADVRVIAATNKNLEEAISNGEFREDLYYRLRVFPMHVPPLRERGQDIILLTKHLNKELASELGLKEVHFSPEAESQLMNYSWPGNVRELKNFLERMIILHSGSIVEEDSLPSEFHEDKDLNFQFDHGDDDLHEKSLEVITQGEIDFKTARNAFEAQFLTSKLEEYDGNITRLAEAIGLERSYLHRKLKSYQIGK